MRGRKPKTTAEKVAEGNPGKRKLKTDIPPTPIGSMSPPRHLDSVEKKIWNETIHNAPRDVIRAADREVLTAFCQQVGMARAAKAELRAQFAQNKKDKKPTMVVDGGTVKNPLLTVLDATAKVIRSLGSELGLSPVSRERLSAEAAVEKSLEELLSESPDSMNARPN